MNRRELLTLLTQTSGSVLAASLLGGCQPKTFDALFLMNLMNLETPLPDHVITPLSEFYVQSYALPSHVNAEKWELKIKGLVKTPIALTLQDILNAPQEEFYLTMECIGNATGGNLIGNARWTGTPLLPFLQKAGIQPEAQEFALQGADWYETTLPIAEILRPDVRLVHRMNGEPLTVDHGYPMRLIVPGHYGQKQPKWLVGIEAIAKPKTGFWENQGRSNTAEIPTHSLVRQVQNSRVWNKHSRVTLERSGELGWESGVLIAGVALDRSDVMSAIDVSTDGGKTWNSVDRNRPDSPHEWTLWRYFWKPTAPGTYTLLAKAKSQRQEQPLEDKTGKDGSSGILRIQVTLSA